MLATDDEGMDYPAAYQILERSVGTEQAARLATEYQTAHDCTWHDAVIGAARELRSAA